MDRLTIRLPYNLGCVPAERIGWQKIADRLAAYEDTGLEPDSIEEAKEAVGRAAIELAYYHKAEQEGRLLVLPCKVGDTVYTIIDGKIYEGEVYHISYSDYYGKVTSAVRTKIDFLTASIGAAFEDFGKTAFFTRAAAGEALAKERDADAL